MDTSNSHALTDFRIADLRKSEFEDEQQQADEASTTVRRLIAQLKPGLKYVVSPVRIQYARGSETECSRSEYFDGPVLWRAAELGQFSTRRFYGRRSETLWLTEDGMLLVTYKCGRQYFGALHFPHCHAYPYVDENAWEEVPFSVITKKLGEVYEMVKQRLDSHSAAVGARAELLQKINQEIDSFQASADHASADQTAGFKREITQL